MSKAKKYPVRLSKLRQSSQAEFAASSFSSWSKILSLQTLFTIYLTNYLLPRRSPKRLAGHLLVLFRQVVNTRSHRHVRQEQNFLELLGGEVVFVISRR